MSFINNLKGRFGFGSRTEKVNKEVMEEREAIEQKAKKNHQGDTGTVIAWYLTPVELWGRQLIYDGGSSIDISFKDGHGNNYRLLHIVENQKKFKSPWALSKKKYTTHVKTTRITLRTDKTKDSRLYDFFKERLSIMYDKEIYSDSFVEMGTAAPGKDYLVTEFIFENLSSEKLNDFISEYTRFFDDVSVDNVSLYNVSRKTYEKEFPDKKKWSFVANGKQ
jgi:hypothetical protein